MIDTILFLLIGFVLGMLSIIAGAIFICWAGGWSEN
jgi:F0F1-type ATP synthase assembly protein I